MSTSSRKAKAEVKARAPRSPRSTPAPEAALLPEIAKVRQASRQMVRELGFLESYHAGIDISHPLCHALIEIEQHGVLTAGELAATLNLDKSTMSRTLGQLQQAGLIEARPDQEDRRRKPLVLTASGRRKLERIHSYASTQVQGALALLADEERATVGRGLELYARALYRLRAQGEFAIRKIQRRDDPEVARLIRTVMPEFGARGPGSALLDAEVNAMSRAYDRPGAGYYVLVRRGERVVGGAGFAPLEGGAAGTCELRKMYFLPEARGVGMGRRLLRHVLAAAGAAGHLRCYLETLESMVQARRLYESEGFRRLKRPSGCTGHYLCDAWYERELDVEGGPGGPPVLSRAPGSLGSTRLAGHLA